MGRLKKVLSCVELPPRHEDTIKLNMAETLQYSFRNIRLDMGDDEWAKMRASVASLGVMCERKTEESGYRLGNPLFLMELKYNEKLKPDSFIHRDRFAVEEQDDNTIHIHYRDLRLRLTQGEYDEIEKAIYMAYMERRKGNASFPTDGIRRLTKTVPIDDVTPYNAIHPVGMEDNAETRDAIAHGVNLLREGKKLRPVMVDANGVMFDGYSRWMAQKQEGHLSIDVLVDPYNQINGQVGQSMEVSDENA